MVSPKRICVVIPTRNEAEVIGGVVESIIKGVANSEIKSYKLEIIVVDDSSDETRTVAQSMGCTVIFGGGQGLGAAMYKGLKFAVKRNPDLILAVDGDGQADAQNEIPKFIEEIVVTGADLVVGSRFREKGLIGYPYRWRNRFGIWILSWILRSFTSLELSDSHGGLRAMVPKVAAELEMIGTHTYVQETIIDAAEKGFRIVEVPTSWRIRRIGKSRVVGSIPAYILHTLPVLFLRSSSHLRLLYTIGLGLIFSALGVFVLILVQEGFSWAMLHRAPAFIFIALLLTTGIQFFFFGFILSILKQLKLTVDKIWFSSGE